MKSPRFLLAAIAAGFLATTTVAFAAPPTADQVSVPSGGGKGGHAKLQALFDNPEQFMMFKAQMHQATKGMAKDQKKAYHKRQMQQVKAMNDAQKAQWRQGLQAQWNALPDAQKTRFERKMATKESRQQAGNAPQGGPSGQGYMDPDSGPGGGSPQ
jgi:hypothetical protein